MKNRLIGTEQGKAFAKIELLYKRVLEDANKNTTTNSDGIKYYIGYTTENEPVAIIKDNILNGVAKTAWIDKVKDTISSKFSDGIAIRGIFIRVNKKTRDEITMSKNTKWYADNRNIIYEDMW